MTVEELIKKLSEFPKDWEVKIMDDNEWDLAQTIIDMRAVHSYGVNNISEEEYIELLI